MDELFRDFTVAQSKGNGYLLATTLTPEAPRHNPGKLYAIVRSSTPQKINADVRYGVIYNNQLSISKKESQAWLEIYVAYWRCIVDVVTAEEQANKGKTDSTQWTKVYESWKEVTHAAIKAYSSGALAAWTVPCLYVVGKYLRLFAIRADQQAAAARSRGAINFQAGLSDDITGVLGKNQQLEDAARQINRIFSLCLGDRAPLEDSRKWAIYYTTNLLFKTYFRLNSISLSKNILRSLQASTTDMPPLAAFPKSHIVTFKYYVGVIHFLEEDYVKAEDWLTQALRLCHRAAAGNRELILTYLIPCHLLTTHTLPSTSLLQPYSRLKRLFLPLNASIRKGDLAAFDAALAAGQDEFVKRRIYLTLERGRDIALRNLFRKVFVAGGFETASTTTATAAASRDGAAAAAAAGETVVPVQTRRVRIPIEEFIAAMRLSLGKKGEDGAFGSGSTVDRDEVECLIANLIYKNLMKGYISREHGKIVLSKKGDAFPGTGV